MCAKRKVAEEVRQNWLWVTMPEYYLDDEGEDRWDLEPGLRDDGWWTCHPETRKGDLVLLWRAKKRKDIGYLFQATEDARDIGRDSYAKAQGWTWGCGWVSRYKFEAPLNLNEIRADSVLQDWPTLSRNFQGKAHRVSEPYWSWLNSLLIKKNPEYKEVFLEAQGSLPQRVLHEQRIENKLAADLGRLKKIGFKVGLADGGRQFICGKEEHLGRIDLLCQTSSGFLVIELKAVTAKQEDVAQLCSYLGYVKKHVARRGQAVEGLLLSRGMDKKCEMALVFTKGVTQCNLSDLGLA